MNQRRFSKWTGRVFRLSVIGLFLLATPLKVAADAPLLSLEVDNQHLDWQDEFVVKLNIYGPQDMELPRITIDGLDQFQLQGTGKNLLQIPRGKTKKWILTYSLVASDTGNFKIGPAILAYQGRTFRSNIVFLTVEPPVSRKPSKPVEPRKIPDEINIPVDVPKKMPAPVQVPPNAVPLQQPQIKGQPVQPPVKAAPIVQPPAKTAPPAAPPKAVKPPPVWDEPEPTDEPIKPPVVMSASKVGDRILILMEAGNNRPYQHQGTPVTVRLLSQLPVENLQFLDEADFPGFLRYDFPFTAKPKGEVVTYRNGVYASYELVRFLLFPLEGGEIQIPPVRCELKVRVPSGAFPDADLKLNLERTSNILNLLVSPSPAGAAVGDFVFRNEIVVDEPQSKVIRMVLEGKGQLSTFNFPEIAGDRFLARTLNDSTTIKFKGVDLISRKTQDVEIIPDGTATNVVLPEVQIWEFDPTSTTLGALLLPSMQFRFAPTGTSQKAKLSFPVLKGTSLWLVYLLLGGMTAFLYFRNIRLPKARARLRLRRLFSNKNLKLQISKSAARSLYQQIAMQIAHQESDTASINESITRHLPQEEWLNIQRGLRKLEHTAYSATKPGSVTYEEIKKLCERIESLWKQ